MIQEYYELDHEGEWLPEGWQKIDHYTKTNGKYKPRKGVFGCRWCGNYGNVEIKKEGRISCAVSEDRKYVAVFNFFGSSKTLLEIYSEEGSVIGHPISVPVSDLKMRERPTFYSIEMPLNRDEWLIKFNNGHDDFSGMLDNQFNVINCKRIRW